MSDLRTAKKDRYRKNLHWIRQRWKDAKSFVSAGDGEEVRDVRLFQAVAGSADTSIEYVKRVYHGKDTSRPILKYLSAGVKQLRDKMGVPEWL